MARETYVYRSGLGVIPKDEAGPRHESRDAPYVISDGMDPIRSMVDGRHYDSKSQYYRSVRAAGCEVIGNDSVPRQRQEMPPIRADLRRAIEQHGG